MPRGYMRNLEMLQKWVHDRFDGEVFSTIKAMHRYLVYLWVHKSVKLTCLDSRFIEAAYTASVKGIARVSGKRNPVDITVNSSPRRVPDGAGSW